MKKMKLWMLAAILTFSGATMLTSCSDDNDSPKTNTERERFEKQLTVTLDNAAEQAQLDPTIKAIEILTSFTNQLNGEAVGRQALKIALEIMGDAYTERPTCDMLSFSDLGEREQEARRSLKSLLGLEEASQLLLVNAKNSIGNRHVTFTQGQKEAELTEDDAFVIEYKDVEAGETTELRFEFGDDTDGIIVWVTNLYGTPIAVQFPANINFTVSTGKTGEGREVTSGTAYLSTLDGSKWFLPKETHWLANVTISSGVNGRTEDITATMSHDAEGAWNVSAGMNINGHGVLSLTANGLRDRYTDDELEQYSDMLEMSRGYRVAYRLLRVFNVRTIDALILTVDEDLTISCQVSDAAKALQTLGNVHTLRHNNGTEADVEPLTKQLNELVTFTASQQSTDIEAEGSLITSFIDNIWQPAPALRFKGETDYLSMYERLSQHDLDNYYKLLDTFDPPYRSIQQLVDAIEEKGKEITGVFKF